LEEQKAHREAYNKHKHDTWLANAKEKEAKKLLSRAPDASTLPPVPSEWDTDPTDPESDGAEA
jgi:hypothetical protein